MVVGNTMVVGMTKTRIQRRMVVAVRGAAKIAEAKQLTDRLTQWPFRATQPTSSPILGNAREDRFQKYRHTRTLIE